MNDFRKTMTIINKIKQRQITHLSSNLWSPTLHKFKRYKKLKSYLSAASAKITRKSIQNSSLKIVSFAYAICKFLNLSTMLLS